MLMAPARSSEFLLFHRHTPNAHVVDGSPDEHNMPVHDPTDANIHERTASQIPLKVAPRRSAVHEGLPTSGQRACAEGAVEKRCSVSTPPSARAV